MKKQFTEEQIIRMPKAHEGGRSARELCWEAWITEQAFYRWKSKFRGMDVSEANRTRKLETENRKLKELEADLSLDNKILKEIVSKN